MKNFLLIFALLFCIGASAQVLTVTVTVTNTAVFPNTFSVNGHLRSWTNNVTAANNQILQTTGSNQTATNLFFAYVTFVENHMHVSLISSNIIQFQSDNGFPNTVAIVGNWAKSSSGTETPTNMNVFRGDTNSVGIYERTNTANGIVQFFSSQAVTNAVPTNAPAMANFLPMNALLGLTNFINQVALNNTNYTLVASNNLYTFIVAATNGIGPSAYHPDNYYQLACANLSDWCNVTTNAVLGALGGLSYLDGSGNIKLIDGNSITRLDGEKAGNFMLTWEDGANFLVADTSHNLSIVDHSGTTRILVEDSGSDNGRTTFRNSDGHSVLIFDGNSDVGKFSAPAIAFNEAVQPEIAIGTVTNFFADVSNSGSSETHVNSFTFPANTLAHNGDTITRTFGVKTAANGNTKTVKVYFDSTALSSASVTTSGAFFYVTITVTRDSSSSYRSIASVTTGSSTLGGTPGVANAFVNSVSGEDFTTTKECNVSVTGTSSSDLTVTLDRIELKPSHDYAF